MHNGKVGVWPDRQNGEAAHLELELGGEGTAGRRRKQHVHRRRAAAGGGGPFLLLGPHKEDLVGELPQSSPQASATTAALSVAFAPPATTISVSLVERPPMRLYSGSSASLPALRCSKSGSRSPATREPPGGAAPELRQVPLSR